MLNMNDFPPRRSSGNAVIECYKRDVDRTLLRENLKLTVEQRLDQLMVWQRFAVEMREAGRRARAGK